MLCACEVSGWHDSVQSRIRKHGFSDAEILDISLAAGARSFFATVLDAVGVEPDDVYMELEERLRQALTVGRSFDEKRGG